MLGVHLGHGCILLFKYCNWEPTVLHFTVPISIVVSSGNDTHKGLSTAPVNDRALGKVQGTMEEQERAASYVCMGEPRGR